MLPQSVTEARKAFRAQHIPEHYSGPRHLATTVTVSLAVAVLCGLLIEAVQPIEWLTVPLTFLYANLCEYLGHRGPMHRKTRFLEAIFERHSVWHHSFFTEEAASYDTSADFKAVLFPPILLIFFVGCFAVPLGAILYILISANVCYLFVLTSVLYFLNYELLHFAYHMDPQSAIGRLPFIEKLRRHHLRHHDRKLMTSRNFNITYPISDYLFGTLYRPGD